MEDCAEEACLNILTPEAVVIFSSMIVTRFLNNNENVK